MLSALEVPAWEDAQGTSLKGLQPTVTNDETPGTEQ